MTDETITIADGLEAAQGRLCEVQSILQLAVERLERIEDATDPTNAVRIAYEMLEGVYEQLQSMLEPEDKRQRVVTPFRRGAAGQAH